MSQIRLHLQFPNNKRVRMYTRIYSICSHCGIGMRAYYICVTRFIVLYSAQLNMTQYVSLYSAKRKISSAFQLGSIISSLDYRLSINYMVFGWTHTHTQSHTCRHVVVSLISFWIRFANPNTAIICTTKCFTLFPWNTKVCTCSLLKGGTIQSARCRCQGVLKLFLLFSMNMEYIIKNKYIRNWEDKWHAGNCSARKKKLFLYK